MHNPHCIYSTKCYKDNRSYFEIYGQVEKVIFVPVLLIDLLQQHFLSVLIRDVLDHDSCTVVLKVQDVVKVKFKSAMFLYAFHCPRFLLE